ncbi:hypothetical protein A4F89_02160 [Polynucleobacter asymbioticus]|jgi:hypothetical protein|uniref:Uncharacterized protein n=1 Tax=Polynucleobacter asymbioticus TaxID=576611 RepID=A0AAC9IU48_9BURK|nr:hypothetical protein A4F89_02160 [Polynucleobacter asymbioticus]APC00510.1 hypothetical protein AOC25_02165 [Polynucleobacter asymbioticus]
MARIDPQIGVGSKIDQSFKQNMLNGYLDWVLLKKAGSVIGADRYWEDEEHCITRMLEDDIKSW